MVPVTERGRATRQRLLEAAEEVFGAEDYFRASIGDIVRIAGVGQGTFYLYFPSKQAIFCELVRWLGKELRRELKEATDGVTPRIAAEVAGFLAFFDFIEHHRRAYRIVKQAETVDPDAYREYYETLALGYRDAITAAIAAHDYAPYRTPEAVAYMLMGLGDFLGMRYQQWETAPIPEAVKADLVEFLHRALLPDRRDGAPDGEAVRGARKPRGTRAARGDGAGGPGAAETGTEGAG